MSDRHVRRSGHDYGDAFLTLLPQGQAWPQRIPARRSILRVAGSPNTGASSIAAPPICWSRRAIRAYDRSELLPDWERNWGLPDPLLRRAADHRRAPARAGDAHDDAGRAVARVLHRRRGDDRLHDHHHRISHVRRRHRPRRRRARLWCGRSRPTRHAQRVGQSDHGRAAATATSRKASCRSGRTTGSGRDTNRFYWTVHVAEAKLIWFRCASGQCGVDPHLRIGLADDLECLLNRWKPAHTQIIFDYSGLETGGDMAGTP